MVIFNLDFFLYLYPPGHAVAAKWQRRDEHSTIPRRRSMEQKNQANYTVFYVIIQGRRHLFDLPMDSRRPTVHSNGRQEK